MSAAARILRAATWMEGKAMVLFVVENVPPGLRGELTQWLLEVKAGVLVGNISASIRDLLWEKLRKQAGSGAALMLCSADTEQGFRMEMFGDPRRSIVDFEGISLIKTKTGES